MKSKLIFGLLAMTLILACASASFAQINLQIFSSPSAQEVINKRTAQTADPLSSGPGVTVSGGIIANAELTTTTLTLTFGAPITATCLQGASCPIQPQAAVPPNDSIRIVAATGLFANVTINTIRYSAGTMDLILPECKNLAAEPGANGVGTCAGNTPSGSFRVVGVRVDVNGKTAPMTVSASLDNGGNNYILTRASDTTISALGAGIAAVTQPASIMTIFSNGTVNGSTKFTLTEGFTSAWRGAGFPGNATSAGASTVQSDQIILKAAGLVAGETLTVAMTSSGTAGWTPTLSGLTFTSAVTTRTISIAGTDLTKTDAVNLTFTLSTAGATFPLALGSVTVTAQMGPIGAALDANNVPTAANGYPVYADANVVGPITVATVTPAQSTLLIPFAVFGGGFDTGIAIANTTADPFTTALGGATAQAGTITLDFFPQLAAGGAGTPSTLTTSATIRPVTGLSADGTLAAGGEWTVLLSNLLPLATPPITGSFTGYIFVRTNFLDAHGVFYPTDFKSFTAGSLMLVLQPPIVTARNGAGAENLNN